VLQTAIWQGAQGQLAARILVVDDAPEMTAFLERVLTKEGYEVAIASDAQEGLRQVYRFRPNLVLLDIMMPDMDGWAMLQRLREFADVPVIMVTALSQLESKVRGLDIGADDYVTKRFDSGLLVIDPSSHQVTVRGKVVDLTPTEYKLLLYLAYNVGQVLTYEQILESVWGPGYEDSPTNVKVYVRRLRQKIESDASQPRYILTQWGIGYFLAKI
jgi:two-component system KDP operon response regulator KdpE